MVRSMDMNLSKLLVIVKSRGTWPVSMRLQRSCKESDTTWRLNSNNKFLMEQR